MDEKKETRQDELKDLDPKKDPKGGKGASKELGGGTGRGEEPQFTG